ICRIGKWRNASAAAATKRITEIAKYFFELTQYLASIESYSLYEGHYNRIKKKLKFSIDDVEPQVPEKTFANFGIQIDLFEKACVDFESQ
ncbi:24713_t:CDS:2, partial [Racocetra persica]